MDAKKELDIAQLMKVSLGRPWILLFREPIVLLLSVSLIIIFDVNSGTDCH
jgi:hypothetical protein